MKKLPLLILYHYSRTMRNVPDLHDMESERNVPEIFSNYDIEKDAWNWRCAVNRFTNWRWYERMDEEAQNIFKKIKWLSFDDSLKILVPFLEKKYNENREEIDDAARQIKVELDKQKNQIFELMVKLTKSPIYNENFQFWYTTCQRWPYNWETWEIWTMEPPKKDWRLSAWTKGFIHELLHFQTHKYYENEYPMNQLNWKQFNLIKESLTFLLNHEFPWVNMAIDRWYPQHQEYRKVLEDYRLSCWDKKDFEDLINFGCNYILENKILIE